MSSRTCFCRSVRSDRASTAARTAESGRPVLQDPGLDVERLGGDPQALGDLLQDLRAGPAQPALDLAEVGVGHARGRGQLAQRDLGLLPLSRMYSPMELTSHGTQISSQSFTACNCKQPSKHPGARVSHQSPGGQHRPDLTHQRAAAETAGPAEPVQGRLAAGPPAPSHAAAPRSARDGPAPPPSSNLTAAARPSARANASTPSAPDLTSRPGTAAISPAPARGCPMSTPGGRAWRPRRCVSAEPGCEHQRAEGAGDTRQGRANSGAPQPSTPAAVTGSPASRLRRPRIAVAADGPGRGNRPPASPQGRRWPAWPHASRSS